MLCTASGAAHGFCAAHGFYVLRTAFMCCARLLSQMHALRLLGCGPDRPKGIPRQIPSGLPCLCPRDAISAKEIDRFSHRRAWRWPRPCGLPSLGLKPKTSLSLAQRRPEAANISLKEKPATLRRSRAVALKIFLIIFSVFYSDLEFEFYQ